jgi:hypothetical protein
MASIRMASLFDHSVYSAFRVESGDSPTEKSASHQN